MSLVNRKPRPLKRDAESLRDDRLFIVASDDTYAPKQYFDLFQLSRVKVFVVPTVDGESSANHVLKRLLEYEHEEDDQRWLLLDTDHYTTGNNLPNFMKSIAEARQKGIRVAVSKPCFDLWLLLHQVEETEVSTLTNCKDVAEKFRATVGEFNKTNIKAQHYSLPAVVNAYLRARRLDKNVEGGDNPKTNTTRVYNLLQEIINKSLPSQLPAALAELRE